MVKNAASKLGCLVLKTPFTYLGTKVGGNMSRKQTWKEVVDKVSLLKWVWAVSIHRNVPYGLKDKQLYGEDDKLNKDVSGGDRTLLDIEISTKLGNGDETPVLARTIVLKAGVIKRFNIQTQGVLEVEDTNGLLVASSTIPWLPSGQHDQTQLNLYNGSAKLTGWWWLDGGIKKEAGGWWWWWLAGGEDERCCHLDLLVFGSVIEGD
ncbi:hypothetical protein Tco_0693585 [Tanacetum coccineum]